jgi:TatD DNase family protein
MNNYIVDSHCHLDLILEKGFNIDEIVKNAQENDVRLLQTICTKISEIDNIIYFANKYKNIYASVGVHPCNVNQEGIYSSQQILSIIQQNPKIIGIGETGLDYYHDTSFIKKQQDSFIEHIKSSQQSQLPTIIHNRNSDKDMADILQSEQKNKSFPALIHCFSSTKSLAKTALDLGMYISISGIVTFKNAKELQELVKFIPLDRILVETDSPYLAPSPNRGKINQPAFTKYIVDFIATLKNVSRETIKTNTTNNFHKLFTKALAI